MGCASRRCFVKSCAVKGGKLCIQALRKCDLGECEVTG
jgi:hypothetical protein